MGVKKFSKREAVKFGWDTTKRNFWFFAGVVAFAGFLRFVGTFIERMSEDAAGNIPASLLVAAVGLALWAFNMIVQMGMIKIGIKFADGQKGAFDDLFSSYKLFFRYLAGSALYALIIAAGIILLVVPGIIWGVQFQFFGFLIMDKGIGPVAALKESSRLTKGSRWNLFQLEILSVLIVLAGVACLFLGLFAAIPVVLVAYGYVYRKLSGGERLTPQVQLKVST